MEIMVIGLNHSTAPVEVRERITFPGDDDGAVTRMIGDVEGVEEAIVFSTCNRAEVLLTAADAGKSEERLIRSIGEIHGQDPSTFRSYLYVRHGADAVQHVFRVAASLDSMVLGEPQILGQVKEGYRRATKARTTGPILNRLMHRAFFAAKRVRTETGVGSAAVSVAYVAVELARKILGELRDQSILLVGAGEMAELAARHLNNQVDRPIVVANRTYENACILAEELHGLPVGMERLEQQLIRTDVVITSTGSCDPIIGTAMLKNVMRARRYRPIFLIDIAIPRDVDPGVNEIDSVYLYNIDDLQAVVAENVGERRKEALSGELIVSEETEKFMHWTKTLDAAPTIVALKEKLEHIRATELARLNGKFADLDHSQREALESVTRQIINKIAHDPIVFLKKTGSHGKQNVYLDTVQRIFRLNGAAENQDESEEP